MTKKQAREKKALREMKELFALLEVACAPVQIQFIKPSQAIYCYSDEVYNACVAGAESGYNRATYDFAYLKAVIKAKSNIDGKVPVTFLMEHHHKHGQPCEVHARVMLGSTDFVFDIPMGHWNHLNGNERRELETAAMGTGEPSSTQSKRL